MNLVSKRDVKQQVSQKKLPTGPCGHCRVEEKGLKKRSDVRSITGKQKHVIQFVNVALLTIRGKQFVAIYFPNVDLLMIKGKQHFVFYFPNVEFFMIKGKQLLCYFSSFGYLGF